MLFLLYEWLKGSDAARWFNFLRYPTFRIIAAGVFALVLGMIVGPKLIQQLKERQHGQSNVREDTPDTHKKKKGTPTMGGYLVLLCIGISTLVFADLHSRQVWAVLIVLFGYGFTGFLDDWLKLSKRNSKGLAGRYKIVLQTVFFLVAIFAVLTEWTGGRTFLIDTHLTLPFVPTKYFSPEIPWVLYIFFAWIVVVGTSNAVNLTDGLDGLAIGPTIVAALVWAVLCYVAGSSIHIADLVEMDGGSKLVGVPVWRYLGVPQVVNGAELAVFCAAMVGASIAFLWFNTYPASVFMGDLGALAIGGALGMLAILSKNEVVSIIIHLVFFAEILSVIAQVGSFKLTKKRIFKMAPIHHHFELIGWPEPKIIVRFWIISIVCGGIALLSLKLR
ncbi:MAG: phospho-N-acetylmuramoyl-pentapeptide-transferase [Myxococcaceae bacterium]